MSLKTKLMIAATPFVAWLAIAHIVYAFRNPDMTETRRFLNTKDALLFRK